MAACPPAKSAPRPFCGSDFCGSDFCGSDFCGSDFCGSDIRLSFQIWFG
ncbi:pentapeptide repeat-containing protein [Klebsiella pneumoniae]